MLNFFVKSEFAHLTYFVVLLLVNHVKHINIEKEIKYDIIKIKDFDVFWPQLKVLNGHRISIQKRTK